VSRIELPFSSGRYKTIEVDPPWKYQDHGYNGFNEVQKYRIHTPYPTMSVHEIASMGFEIDRIAAPAAHVYLWTTKDFILDCGQILSDWGFENKQIFTWIKTTKPSALRRSLQASFKSTVLVQLVFKLLRSWGLTGKPVYGMGHWCRNGTEFLILAARGKLLLSDSRFTTPNYFFAPRGRHSEKPGEAYGLIESLSPGPRISLFSRKNRPGWDNWGNEIVQLDEERQNDPQRLLF